jgi:transposase-like protein
VADLAREHGISEATIYTWKGKYGGMEVSEAQRLKSLEDENRRLKHLVADLSLDKEVMCGVRAAGMSRHQIAARSCVSGLWNWRANGRGLDIGAWACC